MIGEILKEVASLEDIKDALNEHVLLWAHRVQVQKSTLNEYKRGKRIKHYEAKYAEVRPCGIWSEEKDRCKYSDTGHPPRQCPAYGKKCGECGKENHLKVVCTLTHWQQQDQWDKKKVQEISQEDNSCIVG